MRKYWHIWVGVAILLLAILTVLGVVFLPRLAAKSDMRDILERAAAPDAQYVMLIDPTFKHEGFMAGEGREMALTGTLLENTRESLAAIAEELSFEKKEGAISGALGLQLLVKTAEGEILKIYLGEATFYAELKGAAYHFSADGYALLYQMLLASF